MRFLAHRLNDYELAASRFRESLAIQQSMKEYWRALILIETVAALLVPQHDLLGAVRLYGAADQLRRTLQVLPLPLYRSLHEHSLTQLETALSSTALAEARLAGQQLSLDQAILYALRCLE